MWWTKVFLLLHIIGWVVHHISILCLSDWFCGLKYHQYLTSDIINNWSALHCMAAWQMLLLNISGTGFFFGTSWTDSYRIGSLLDDHILTILSIPMNGNHILHVKFKDFFFFRWWRPSCLCATGWLKERKTSGSSENKHLDYNLTNFFQAFEDKHLDHQTHIFRFWEHTIVSSWKERIVHLK